MSFVIIRDVLGLNSNNSGFHDLNMLSMRQSRFTQRKKADKKHADQNERLPKSVAKEDTQRSVYPIFTL